MLYCPIAEQSKNVSNQLHSEAVHMIRFGFYRPRVFLWSRAVGGLLGSSTLNFPGKAKHLLFLSSVVVVHNSKKGESRFNYWICYRTTNIILPLRVGKGFLGLWKPLRRSQVSAVLASCFVLIAGTSEWQTLIRLHLQTLKSGLIVKPEDHGALCGIWTLAYTSREIRGATVLR